MNTLDYALHLAGLGFYVFPCKANSKLPAIKGFPAQATRDPNKIKAWWNRFGSDTNIGLYTGRFGSDETEALVAVDVDVKNGKKGDETLLALELEGFELPRTFTQTTPTGGKHYVFRTRKNLGLHSGTNVIGPGCDIRANGGYIVGTGSCIESGVYTDNQEGITGVPSWLLQHLLRQQDGVSIGKLAGGTEFASGGNGSASSSENRVLFTKAGKPIPSAEIRGKYFLERESDFAVQGQGGDETTYKTAARLKDFGCTEKEAFELMRDHWNSRCVPPWSPEELKVKVQNAYKYGARPPAIDAPENQFSAGEEEGGLSYLEQINREYALLFAEGEHVILHETKDEKSRDHLAFMTEAAFKRKFSNKKVMIEKRETTQARAWLDWPGRREYRGIIFAPEREVKPGFYNMWKGFAVTPIAYEKATPQAKAGFDMFLTFAKKTVCQNDPALFNWLVNFCAHMIQKPWERPLTTLVFQGGKGTGKNEFINRIGSLLGSRHFSTVHDPRYLTSNFNSHLEHCLCLVLDEAFWSGDKAAESKLKGLTTASEILIERKFREPYLTDNLTRLVVIGNERWVVPASEDERRYAVFKFGEDRKQDARFFVELKRLMEDRGGKNVLMHYFLNRDISSMNLSGIPTTKGLLDQKLASLDAVSRWWFDCLAEMRILGEEFEKEWPQEINRERFRTAFKKYAREHNVRNWLVDEYSFGRIMRQLVPGIESIRKKTEDGRKRAYVLPDLDHCRFSWEKHIGQIVQWDVDFEKERG